MQVDDDRHAAAGGSSDAWSELPLNGNRAIDGTGGRAVSALDGGDQGPTRHSREL